MNNATKRLFDILGVAQTPVSHTEKIVSAIGGFVAIYAILQVSLWVLDPIAAAMIVASMGASSVLLFAVPHGPLSQPWSVLGGHLASALVGVTCAMLIPDQALAAGAAVGIAIGIMYYLKCIHPPGGATALSAVIGGESVHALGYQFFLTPVLLNVIVILSVALLFNAFFHWRRYPAWVHKSKQESEPGSDRETISHISHEDFVYALSEIDSFIDIDEDDLLRIYKLATRKSQETSLTPDQLHVGHFYSNGKYGEEWSVRKIVDASDRLEAEDTVIFKVVAGNGRRSSGYSTVDDFLRWANYRVILDEENWKRVDDT